MTICYQMGAPNTFTLKSEKCKMTKPVLSIGKGKEECLCCVVLPVNPVS